jgi:hypothetical protein
MTREAAVEMCRQMFTALQQNYRMVGSGEWWLYNEERPIRPLTRDEVAWHTSQRHQPFVEDGFTPDQEEWWEGLLIE